MAFLPDERLLVATQQGQIRIIEDDVLRPGPVLDISAKVCGDTNRGLLGIAVDPSFVANRYVFLYYTFKKFGHCTTQTEVAPENAQAPVNRVSRFTVASDGTINVSSEKVLIDNIPSPKGYHGGGDIDFGKDDAMYVTSGDGGCDFWPGLGWQGSGCATKNDAARDKHTLLGKVLRITRDGAIPADNPNRGANSDRCNLTARTTKGRVCQENFATGLRSPFRFAFDPNAAGTRFFINDVGQDTWEEINEGAANADYGWNLREAACVRDSSTDCPPPPAGLTDPIHSYAHTTGCSSVTAGAFVPDNLWPQIYDGAYLYADYACGTMFRLSENGAGYTSEVFASDFGANSAVDMLFGPVPDGGRALYYANYDGGGEIGRIAFEGGDNRVPTARVSASPTAGATPLLVQFDGGESSDPDGDSLTYLWDFGDGSTPPMETPIATISHLYTTDGAFTATLRVRDSAGAVSAPAEIKIHAGNEAPQPTIASPTSDQTFAVGQRFRLKGSASDPEDGALPDSALEWEVKLHHKEHTHPFFAPTTGNDLLVIAPEPENLLAAKTSYLEVILKATDSEGQTVTVTRDFQPRKSDLTLNTVPAGQSVEVDGVLMQAPVTVTSWQGYRVSANVPDQSHGTSGAPLEWESWSDGGPQMRTLTTTSASRTLTSSLRPVGGSGLLGRYYNSLTPAGTSPFRRVDSRVDFNWGTGGPPTIQTDGFSVWWNGDVRPNATGQYKFEVHSDDGVRLTVGGQRIIDDWTPGPYRARTATVNLVAGLRHTIKLEYFDQSDAAAARLFWTPPNAASREVIPTAKLYPSGTGLTGRYYADTTFGNLKLTRPFQTIEHDWGVNSPHGGLPSDGFSVRWSGQIEARHRQRYTLYLRADDKARVWIGDSLVVDGWDAPPGTQVTGTVDFEDSRKYPIVVEYLDDAGDANVKLEWSSAQQSRQVIPQDRLFPPVAPAPS